MRKLSVVLFGLVLSLFSISSFAVVLLDYMPPGDVWGPGSAVPHACKVYKGTQEEQYAVKYIA